MMGGHERRRAVYVILAVSVLTMACSSASSPAPSLSSPLIAAFNAEYRDQTPATTMTPYSPANAPPISERAAVAEAVTAGRRSCNDGADPTVVGVGLVKVTDPGLSPPDNDPQWAVFVNPPGAHYLGNGAGTGGEVANWYVVLVDADGAGKRVGCSVGRYSPLPALPVHH
jgi:hypothetical protein